MHLPAEVIPGRLFAYEARFLPEMYVINGFLELLVKAKEKLYKVKSLCTNK